MDEIRSINELDMAVGKSNVLFVDDNQDNIDAFVALFSGDYKIFTATSGVEGLKVLDKKVIHLILTDQQMPKMTGIDFLKAVRKTHAELPCILLTNDINNDLLDKEINSANIFHYISKPFDKDDLKWNIDQAIETYQLKTRLKEKAKHLQESEERFNKLFETTLDAIITIDETYNIAMVNPAAEKMFGYPPNELIGKPLIILIPKDIRPKHDNYITGFEKSDEKVKFMGQGKLIYGLKSTGDLFPMETTLSKMNIDGKSYYNAIVRDITRRVEIEKLLKESEANFRSLAENAPVFIAKADTNYAIQYINYVGEGFKYDEVIGTSVFNFISKEDQSRIKKVIDKVLKTGEKGHYEITFPSPETNEIRSYSVNVGSIKENSKITGFLLVAEDVTELKKKEKEIEASEYKFRRLAESAPVFIVMCDLEYKIQYANQLAAGLTLEQIIGSPIFNFLPEEDHKRVKKVIDNVLKTGESGHYDIAIAIPETGNIAYYSVNAGAIKELNKIKGFLLVTEDVTELKRKEKEIETSEANFRSLAENAPVIIVKTDTNYKIEYVNQVNKDRSINEVIGVSIFSFLSGEEKARIKLIVDRVLKTGKKANFEVTGPKSGNNMARYSANVGLIVERGKITGILFVAEDITEIKNAQQLLEKSESEFRELFENSIDELYLVDPIKLIINNVNATALNELGYKKNELIGKNLTTIFPSPSLLNQNRFRIENVIKGKTEIFKFKHKRKDDTIYPVELKLKLFDVKGHKFLLGLARKINEQNKVK